MTPFCLPASLEFVRPPLRTSGFELAAFDLDNTLVSTERIAIPDAVTQFREDHGVTGISEEDWHKPGGYQGLAGKDMLARIATDYGVRIALEDYTARRLERIKHLFANQRPVIAPGVDALLARLQQAQVPLCVVSNSTKPRIVETLRLARLHTETAVAGQDAAGGKALCVAFGTRIFSSQDGDVAALKPAPDVYLKAALSMGVEPAAALAFEDSAAGVAAAVAAGFTCGGYIGLAHDPARQRADLAAAGAHFVFERWGEVV